MNDKPKGNGRYACGAFWMTVSAVSVILAASAVQTHRPGGSLALLGALALGGLGTLMVREGQRQRDLESELARSRTREPGVVVPAVTAVISLGSPPSNTGPIAIPVREDQPARTSGYSPTAQHRSLAALHN